MKAERERLSEAIRTAQSLVDSGEFGATPDIEATLRSAIENAVHHGLGADRDQLARLADGLEKVLWESQVKKRQIATETTRKLMHALQVTWPYQSGQQDVGLRDLRGRAIRLLLGSDSDTDRLEQMRAVLGALLRFIDEQPPAFSTDGGSLPYWRERARSLLERLRDSSDERVLKLRRLLVRSERLLESVLPHRTVEEKTKELASAVSSLEATWCQERTSVHAEFEMMKLDAIGLLDRPYLRADDLAVLESIQSSLGTCDGSTRDAVASLGSWLQRLKSRLDASAEAADATDVDRAIASSELFSMDDSACDESVMAPPVTEESAGDKKEAVTSSVGDLTEEERALLTRTHPVALAVWDRLLEFEDLGASPDARLILEQIQLEVRTLSEVAARAADPDSADDG